MSLGNIQKVSVQDLVIGMFVSGLDRPWLDSPFSFQGFLLSNNSEIELLRKHCSYVYVDEQQGLSPAFMPKAPRHHAVEAPDSLKFEAQAHPGRLQPPSFEQQKKAMLAYRGLEKLFVSLTRDIANNRPIIIPQINKYMTPLVECVSENLAALLQLILLTPRELNIGSEAITTSIIAAAIGQRLELHKQDLVPLATGAMLLDIGKLKLPQELLDEPRAFTPIEFQLVKSHVRHSYDIVRHAVGSDPAMLDMVQYHHERYNGSGYPTGLRHDNIPLAARIAGVADCFSAIVSDRPYAPAMSPYFAAQKLMEWRNEDFDSDIVDALVQEIGIYPIGTIVELSNGMIAIVVANAQRLRPQVVVILNQQKIPLARKRIVDLQRLNQRSDGPTVKIKNAVNNGVYKLDLNNLPL